jgi:hypothetical protein
VGFTLWLRLGHRMQRRALQVVVLQPHVLTVLQMGGTPCTTDTTTPLPPGRPYPCAGWICGASVTVQQRQTGCSTTLSAGWTWVLAAAGRCAWSLGLERWAGHPARVHAVCVCVWKGGQGTGIGHVSYQSLMCELFHFMAAQRTCPPACCPGSSTRQDLRRLPRPGA